MGFSELGSLGGMLGRLALVTLLFALAPQSARASSIFWTDAAEVGLGSGLYRVSPVTGDPELLVPSSSSTGVAYDPIAERVYWAQRVGDEQIFRADPDGGNVESVVATGVDMRGIAVDPLAGKLYWTNGVTMIQRSNLDGSNVEVVFDGAPSQITWDLALDPLGGKIYWTTLDRDSIRRADLDGSNVEDVVTGIGRPFGIALDLDSGFIYWTSTEDDKIQRADLDGGNVVDVVVAATGGGLGLRGIAVDPAGGGIYWADSSSDTIRRSDLTGTQIETVASGLRSPWDVVFVPEAATLTLLGVGLGGLGIRRRPLMIAERRPLAISFNRSRRWAGADRVR